jgi:hypothetical protein
MNQYVDEKSDSVIVPMKRSNKEGIALGGDGGGKEVA